MDPGFTVTPPEPEAEGQPREPNAKPGGAQREIDHSAAPPPLMVRRAALVLLGLRPTLHHDLPTQLVALNGLLQMLALDEKDRLSSDGQDYLNRLLALTERLQHTLTGLRNLSKILWDNGATETVPVADLGREVAAATKKLFPHRTLTYHLSGTVAEVVAVRRHLTTALLELVRLLLARLSQPVLQVYLWTRGRGNAVEMFLWGREGSAPATGPPSRPVHLFAEVLDELDPDLLGLEHSLTLLLVRELVAACAGSLAVRVEESGSPAFLIHLPDRDWPGQTGATNAGAEKS